MRRQQKCSDGGRLLKKPARPQACHFSRLDDAPRKYSRDPRAEPLGPLPFSSVFLCLRPMVLGIDRALGTYLYRGFGVHVPGAGCRLEGKVGSRVSGGR